MESEMVFILVLALIVLGPRKLPEIGRQIGRALAEFRRAKNEFARQIEDEIRRVEFEEKQKALTATATAISPTAAESRAGASESFNVPVAESAQDGAAAEIQENRIKPPGQAPTGTIASVPEPSVPVAAAVAASQEQG
jgi:sec-independent protein translocase protein TatB